MRNGEALVSFGAVRSCELMNSQRRSGAVHCRAAQPWRWSTRAHVSACSYCTRRAERRMPCATHSTAQMRALINREDQEKTHKQEHGIRCRGATRQLQQGGTRVARAGLPSAEQEACTLRMQLAGVLTYRHNGAARSRAYLVRCLHQAQRIASCQASVAEIILTHQPKRRARQRSILKAHSASMAHSSHCSSTSLQDAGGVVTAACASGRQSSVATIARDVA